MNKKVKKYILKYTLEFLVIVLGISISFSLNKSQNDSKNKEKENIALINLMLDLEEQLAALDHYIIEETEFYNDGIYISKSYKANKSFILNDSIIYKLNNLSIRRTFNPINTTFKELVSTGNIDLLRNKELKRNITKLYNELERVSLVTLNNNTNLIDGLYNPILVKNIPYVFRFNGKKTAITHFKPFIRMQNKVFDLESLNKIYKTSQANINNPENTLNLFNVLQFRIQLASGQKETYTRLSQKISELINEISLYTS